MITIDEAHQLLNKATEQELQAIEFAIKSQCLKHHKQLTWINMSEEAAEELRKHGFKVELNEKQNTFNHYSKIYW